MDYKKKYEQAMLRMNKWVEGSEIIEPKEVAEFVFPELKESKDDIMRKMAIHAVYSPEAQSCIKSWGVEPKDVIAWLEKQAEHANFRNKIQIGDEVTRNEEGALVNLSQFKRIVKQGEQKPIEWNADDLLKRNQIITILKEYNRTDLIAWLEKIEIIWLKSLKERVQPQPKQEWSEEDEKGLGDVLWAIEQARTIAKDENDMGGLWYAEKWLKSLKEFMKGE